MRPIRPDGRADRSSLAPPVRKLNNSKVWIQARHAATALASCTAQERPTSRARDGKENHGVDQPVPDEGKQRLRRAYPPSFLQALGKVAQKEETAENLIKQLQQAHSLELCNGQLEVLFPFKPYPCQLHYMTHLARALLEGKNALLESPTGTGKTLCILSVLLAYQKAILDGKVDNPKQGQQAAQQIMNQMKNREIQAQDINDMFGELEDLHDSLTADHARVVGSEPTSEAEAGRSKKAVDRIECVPRIFYSSRTHSQLVQVVSELKKTPYYAMARFNRHERGAARGRSAAGINSRRPDSACAAANNSIPAKHEPEVVKHEPGVVKHEPGVIKHEPGVVKHEPGVGKYEPGAAKHELGAGDKDGVDKTAPLNGENKVLDIEDIGGNPNFIIRSTCLASRDHYCIHPEAQGHAQLKGPMLNGWCKKHVSSKTCMWHSGNNRELKASDYSSHGAYDIAELRKIAQHGLPPLIHVPFCPFYAARDAQPACSIIFLPYNYLIAPSMRDRLSINFNHDIIIVDEAHNLENVAEDATSFSLTAVDILSVVKAIQNSDLVVGAGGDELTKEDVADLQRYVEPLQELLRWMSDVNLVPSCVDDQERVNTQHLNDFYSQMTQWQLGPRECESLMRLLRKLSLALEADAFSKEITDGNLSLQVHMASTLQQFAYALDILWHPAVQDAHQRFRVVVQHDESVRQAAENQPRDLFNTGMRRVSIGTTSTSPWTVQESAKLYPSRRLNFWSFAAHVAILGLFGHEGGLTGCHSLIVTSGTLKPLNVLALQLGAMVVPFDVQLVNSHVITNDRLFAAIVTRPGKIGILDKLSASSLPLPVDAGKKTSQIPAINPNDQLIMTYQNLQQNESPIHAVGWIIADACRILGDGGILVFFPSYAQMSRFINKWRETSIYRLIESNKQVFVEPRDAQRAAAELENYKKTIEKRGRSKFGSDNLIHSCTNVTARGAIFFGVARGRLSEGLSLSDEWCRLVVMVGIPYPAIGDYRIFLKKVVFNRHPYESKNTKVNGDIWYNRQASLAVNQAAGRIVRHKGDYGGILLLDARWTWKLNDLSGWIQDNLKYHGFQDGRSWADIEPLFRNFFERLDSEFFTQKQRDALTAYKGSSSSFRQPAHQFESRHPLSGNATRHLDREAIRPKSPRPRNQSYQKLYGRQAPKRPYHGYEEAQAMDVAKPVTQQNLASMLTSCVTQGPGGSGGTLAQSRSLPLATSSMMDGCGDTTVTAAAGFAISRSARGRDARFYRGGSGAGMFSMANIRKYVAEAAARGYERRLDGTYNDEPASEQQDRSDRLTSRCGDSLRGSGEAGCIHHHELPQVGEQCARSIPSRRRPHGDEGLPQKRRAVGTCRGVEGLDSSVSNSAFQSPQTASPRSPPSRAVRLDEVAPFRPDESRILADPCGTLPEANVAATLALGSKPTILRPPTSATSIPGDASTDRLSQPSASSPASPSVPLRGILSMLGSQPTCQGSPALSRKHLLARQGANAITSPAPMQAGIGDDLSDPIEGFSD